MPYRPINNPYQILESISDIEKDMLSEYRASIDELEKIIPPYSSDQQGSLSIYSKHLVIRNHRKQFTKLSIDNSKQARYLLQGNIKLYSLYLFSQNEDFLSDYLNAYPTHIDTEYGVNLLTINRFNKLSFNEALFLLLGLPTSFLQHSQLTDNSSKIFEPLTKTKEYQFLMANFKNKENKTLNLDTYFMGITKLDNKLFANINIKAIDVNLFLQKAKDKYIIKFKYRSLPDKKVRELHKLLTQNKFIDKCYFHNKWQWIGHDKQLAYLQITLFHLGVISKFTQIDSYIKQKGVAPLKNTRHNIGNPFDVIDDIKQSIKIVDKQKLLNDIATKISKL